MSEFGVGYDPRSATKAHALPDFIQEMTANETAKQKWLMYADGSLMWEALEEESSW